MKKEVVEELMSVCVELRTCIEKIRYCNWPSIGLGIDLNPDELDELILESDRVIRRTRYNLTKDESMVKRISHLGPNEKL